MRTDTLIVAAVILATAVGSVPAEEAAAETSSGPWNSPSIWLGLLQVPNGPQLRVVIEVFEKADGTLGAAMHSPDQGKMNLTVQDFTLGPELVRFQAGANGPVIEGRPAPDGSKIDAKLGPLPLVLKPVDKVPGLPAKPQTPRQPYPYREQDVVVENEADGVKLAGTLTFPIAGAPFPAVVLVSGSGANDRDGTNLGHFLLLADYLTRHGMAVLRYDKRGVMRSTGAFSEATMEDFAGDALACVRFMQRRPDVDPGKVGLLGHSEGAIVSAMAAAESKNVAFVVMMGGSGLNGFDLMVLQDGEEARARGATEEDIALIRAWVTRFYTIVRDEPEIAQAREGIEALYQSVTSQERIAFGADGPFPRPGTTLHIDVALSPWFREFVRFDPQPALRKVPCPVLALVGGKDAQVPPRENARGIQGALRTGECGDFTVKELAGLNHLFQTAKTGAVSEYGQLDEIIAPKALISITYWIMGRTGLLD